jgi:Xaa-Pro dipeptidase
MNYRRRDFINLSFITAGAGILTGFSTHKDQQNKPDHERGPGTDPSFYADVIPISLAERQARIEKAQRLMHEQNSRAMVLDAGTALEYFTGVSWWPSERTLVAIIPAKGEPAFVCPAFEEPRLRELIKIGKKVLVWQEDESPFKQIALAFKDLGIQTGNIACRKVCCRTTVQR